MNSDEKATLAIGILLIVTGLVAAVSKHNELSDPKRLSDPPPLVNKWETVGSPMRCTVLYPEQRVNLLRDEYDGDVLVCLRPRRADR